ncbi:DUF3995 domain-containing protein [Bacillus sp. JCM 19034]|uniref:DUF3995 domain-containing protein n=1 Tax=Bacillus sp. JCM 19034 TaxID=1481928 RepID=UPI000A80AD76|nr:DUF3995 domain-containing protein [Bacillus sp. JCM 19034]
MSKNNVWLKTAAFTACMTAIVYALPHFWWGLGISLAFPGDFNSVPNDPVGNFIAYWVMGIISLAAAVFAFAFVLPWGKRIPRLLLLIPAWLGAIGLTVWGFGFIYLRFFLFIGRVESAPAFALQDSDPTAVGWATFWYGLFIIWGIALGTAAFQFKKTHSTL